MNSTNRSIELFNMDCMDAMKDMPDASFDLAIVDPPYGGGGQSAQTILSTELYADVSAGGSRSICATPIKTVRGGEGLNATTIKAGRTGGTWASKYQGGIFDDDITNWDYAPPPEYFAELARVSKAQIIWGGNYFDLPPTRCFLVWRKTNIPLKGFTMSPVEYAWTSFNRNAAMFEYASSGTKSQPRFHPTQKPVALYEWQLANFAERGMRILDTHAGSASLAIACYRLGFDYVGYEINEIYYRLAQKRIDEEMQQLMLF